LVEDIEYGKLNESLLLSAEERSRFSADCVPDHARAVELRQAHAQGFTHIIPRIWPDM
jgi:hypothetical protein